MATPVKKTALGQLIEELPGQESKPETANDVLFDVEVRPYVVCGRTYYRWEILEHGYRGYVGDHRGHNDAGYYSAPEAEAAARVTIEAIRTAVQLKLDAPGAYTITL